VPKSPIFFSDFFGENVSKNRLIDPQVGPGLPVRARPCRVQRVPPQARHLPRLPAATRKDQIPRLREGQRSRVARFFVTHYTKIRRNVPNVLKLYQMAIKYPKVPYNFPNGRKIYQ
jgi:hypothetical protein